MLERNYHNQGTLFLHNVHNVVSKAGHVHSQQTYIIAYIYIYKLIYKYYIITKNNDKDKDYDHNRDDNISNHNKHPDNNNNISGTT